MFRWFSAPVLLPTRQPLFPDIPQRGFARQGDVSCRIGVAVAAERGLVLNGDALQILGESNEALEVDHGDMVDPGPGEPLHGAHHQRCATEGEGVVDPLMLICLAWMVTRVVRGTEITYAWSRSLVEMQHHDRVAAPLLIELGVAVVGADQQVVQRLHSLRRLHRAFHASRLLRRKIDVRA